MFMIVIMIVVVFIFMTYFMTFIVMMAATVIINFREISSSAGFFIDLVFKGTTKLIAIPVVYMSMFFQLFEYLLLPANIGTKIRVEGWWKSCVWNYLKNNKFDYL